MTGPNELKLKIASLAPGTVAHFKIDRDGQQRDVSVTLGELPEKAAKSALRESGTNSPMHGVEVDELTPQVARELGLRPGTNPAAPAADAGLHRGDAIEEVNRQSVSSVSEYQRVLSQAGKQPVALSVNRHGNTAYILVQPE